MAKKSIPKYLQRKTINGKTYTLVEAYPYRFRADIRAKAIRKRGYNARVVEIHYTRPWPKSFRFVAETAGLPEEREEHRYAVYANPW